MLVALDWSPVRVGNPVLLDLEGSRVGSGHPRAGKEQFGGG